MGKTEQVAAFVSHLSLIVIVGIVASADNLVGDGEPFREGVFKNVADFPVGISRGEVSFRLWTDVHVSTVTAAAERTDDAVGESFACLTAVPCDSALYVCFYGMEIQVDEMGVYKWTLVVFCRQVVCADTLVRRVVLPVDRVCKVKFLCIVFHITVELLEQVHKVVVFGCVEQFVAIAAHKDTSYLYVTSNVYVYITDRLVGIFAGAIYLLYSGRVSTAIHITVNLYTFLVGVSLDADVYPVGKRAP